MPCICPRIKKKTMIELAFKINITYQFNIVCEIMKFKDCHFKGAKYGASGNKGLMFTKLFYSFVFTFNIQK